MVLMEQQYGMTRLLKLLGLVTVLALLTACQTSPQRAPIEDTSERRTPYPDRGVSVPGAPDAPEVYPAPTPRNVPVERPETTRPPEPPSVDAAVDAIEADARRYMGEREWKKSLEAAEHGLRIDRRNAEFYRIMGESYRQLGDIPQAERFARQAQRYCRFDCGSTRQLLKALNLD